MTIVGLRKTMAQTAAWMGLKLGLFLVPAVPRRWFIPIADGASGLAFHLFRSFRNRSRTNLSIALGVSPDAQETLEIVRRSLRNFFRSFVETGLAGKIPAEEMRDEIPLYGRQHLDAARAKGKGVILLSAHLGNFFLLGTRLAAEGYPAYVLVKQAEWGSLSKLMDDWRSRLGQRTIHARPRAEASRELLRVLRRNDPVIVIADEYRSRSGIEVPFFDRTVLARRGPATLARRTGAAVVPAYLVRGPGGGLALHIEPEIELRKSGDVRADVIENSLRITRWLERTVRRYPDQWNWMNIRWQQTSPGARATREDGRKPPGIYAVSGGRESETP